MSGRKSMSGRLAAALVAAGAALALVLTASLAIPDTKPQQFDPVAAAKAWKGAPPKPPPRSCPTAAPGWRRIRKRP